MKTTFRWFGKEDDSITLEQIRHPPRYDHAERSGRVRHAASGGQFPRAIRYLEEHAALLSDFVTQTFPLQQAKEAFDFVTENPAQVRKAVVMME